MAKGWAMPVVPDDIDDLDLVKRLRYFTSTGWPTPDAVEVTPSECEELRVGLLAFLKRAVVPTLSRTTSRDLDTFTMHDAAHGRKVAHVMWYILKPELRDRLNPAELALLVAAAFFHDIGMALSHDERLALLKTATESGRLTEPKRQPGDTDVSYARLVLQAQEAFLCQTAREQHAADGRYRAVLETIAAIHQEDPSVPDPTSSLMLGGGCLADALVEVCASHGRPASALVAPSDADASRPRLPVDWAVGGCTANLKLVAATLRLADILDFDRERTPPVLFYYLIPRNGYSESALHWEKHMSVSGWRVEPEAIVFKGQCTDCRVHHAISLFCRTIEKEIRTTNGVLEDWPFSLPLAVDCRVRPQGYTYSEYRFELDEERVYSLLMGRSLYRNPLACIRELIQNSVDACKLRDALDKYHGNEPVPLSEPRIIVRYIEPGGDDAAPRIVVRDNGTGMDRRLIEDFFLNVGRSYYRSEAFLRERATLRSKGLDFAPVSDFGIGFMSVFMLADRVQVETAKWESDCGDTTKRTLVIDGPTRLVRLTETPNRGHGRFKGTAITLHLAKTQSSGCRREDGWNQLVQYVRETCQRLPYALRLELVKAEGPPFVDWVGPMPLTVSVPRHLEEAATRIELATSSALGLMGEIALLSPYLAQKAEKELLEAQGTIVINEDNPRPSCLMRGGFAVGTVPGLPGSFLHQSVAQARLELNWEETKEYLRTDLSRCTLVELDQVADNVRKAWLTYLIENRHRLKEGQLYHLEAHFGLGNYTWLAQYSALELYDFASQGWHFWLLRQGTTLGAIHDWEAGTGKPLRSGFRGNGVWEQILETLLPRVTCQQVGPEATFYYAPPRPDWRETLRGCPGYPPGSWGLFVEYVGGLEGYLYYDYPRLNQLNARFRDRLADFSPSELAEVPSVLNKVISGLSDGVRPTLSRRQADLFGRLRATAGDLRVAALFDSWPVNRLRN